MKRAVFTLIVVAVVGFGSIIAQQSVTEMGTGTTTTTGSVTQQEIDKAQAPTLTAEQQASLENRILKMEQAARDLSPEAIGKAIEQLMTQRQQTYQQIANDLNTYSTTLNKPGWNLTRDPQTGAFSYVKAGG